MTQRFPLPSLDGLSADQQAVADAILGRRPSIDGPFLAWLHRPALASAAERLGAHLRFDTGLSPRESEWAILCVAALADCEGEKRIHAPIALGTGLAPGWVEQLRAGTIPEPQDERLSLIARVCRESLRQWRLSPALQQEALGSFGPGGLVELLALIGYYTLVALTLNVCGPFEAPLETE